MTVTFGFYNSLLGDRTYDAVQMSSIFDGIITDGIFAGIGSALVVTPHSGMTVSVGSGRAWFNHTWTNNDAALLVTLLVSEIVLDRIDMVVLEVDASEAIRANSIKVISGTPSSEPIPPVMVDTETIHQYPLAQISVPAGITEATDILDLVGSGSTPFATGVLETPSGTAVKVPENKIVNGAMLVAQQGSSAAGLAFNSYPPGGPDLMYHECNLGGTWTYSQASDTFKDYGFAKSLRMVCTVVDPDLSTWSYSRLHFKLRGRDLQEAKKGLASAESFSLTLLVKSNVIGTYNVELFDQVNERTVTSSFVIEAVNTPQQVNITFPPDTIGELANSTGYDLSLAIWLSAGSAWTTTPRDPNWRPRGYSNRAYEQVNLASAVGNYIEITGLGLYIGDTIPEFKHQRYDQVLRDVQENYIISGTLFLFAMMRWSFSAGTAYSTWHTPVRMVTPPAVTMKGTWSSGDGYQTPTVGGSRNSMVILQSSGSVPAGGAAYAHGGYIELDSRL